MAELARLPTVAVVVEGTYTQVLRRGYVNGAWLGELLARLQMRYPAVPIAFVETRALGGRWTFDFYRAASAEREAGVSLLALIEEPAPKKRRRKTSDETE